ncbi:Initiation factor 2B-related protein [Ascosphaera apis ARSEF 7405]|uniref:Initiation factor 2B-related protein n=1 Tax=Ascosphaera apis ARSEF 7405 TaxID=392613 RepID=A0A167ZGM1_9EURO|nr:Initiation factor 2B-related protein [Ascosphaera apis ARSEF 7405]
MESYPYAGLSEVPHLSLSYIHLLQNDTAEGVWFAPENQENVERDVIPKLLTALRDIRGDHVSGAKDLATKALAALTEIAENGARVVIDGEKLASAQEVDDISPSYFTERWWGFTRRVAWIICQYGRPSMGAAINSTLTNSLERHHLQLDNTERTPVISCETAVTRCLQILRHDLELRRSNQQMKLIVGHVREMIQRTIDENQIYDEEEPFVLNILTLSNSSTTANGLLAALSEKYQLAAGAKPTHIRMHVRLLESRPLCEGASFARRLQKMAQERNCADRLTMEIAADSAVAERAENIHIVVLGADRVTNSGDVLNKMGSFPAALCAKTVTNGQAKVVAIFEKDKIAKPGKMTKVDEDNDSSELTAAWSKVDQGLLDEYPTIKCRNLYFEWVPAKYIDYYVCDAGLWSAEEIDTESRKKAEIEEQVFEGFSA